MVQSPHFQGWIWMRRSSGGRMERRERGEDPGERTRHVLLSDVLHRIGPRCALLALACLSNATFALAEPAELPPVSAPPPASIQIVASLPPEVSALPIEAATPAAETPAAAPAIAPELDELLFVPGARRDSWRARTTDEAIADAVALGTNPDLEPRNPFRKRSRDLFRTERPVTIGRQELLMRLRLKAKASEAVSVEFRF